MHILKASIFSLYVVGFLLPLTTLAQINVNGVSLDETSTMQDLLQVSPAAGDSFNVLLEGVLQSAMTDFENNQPGASLELRPRTPKPNHPVTISINDYSINTTGSKIEWYVDGKLVVEYNNQRSITLISPQLGAETIVEARFIFSTGRTLEARRIIKPIQIDVIIEADTRVPVFYQGRSLPVQQGTFRAVAYVYTDASGIPARGLSYRWLGERKVADSGALFEGSVMTFTPPLRRNFDITLEVFDSDGNFLGSTVVDVPLVRPELIFYEINPLRGQSLNAIGNAITMTGNELGVRADLFYVSNTAYSDPSRLLSWKIGGREVATDENEPYVLTVTRQNGTGTQDIEMVFRSRSYTTQTAGNRFRIDF